VHNVGNGDFPLANVLFAAEQAIICVEFCNGQMTQMVSAVRIQNVNPDAPKS
jgi:hypothetical protein